MKPEISLIATPNRSATYSRRLSEAANLRWFSIQYTQTWNNRQLSSNYFQRPVSKKIPKSSLNPEWMPFLHTDLWLLLMVPLEYLFRSKPYRVYMRELIGRRRKVCFWGRRCRRGRVKGRLHRQIRGVRKQWLRVTICMVFLRECLPIK